jgi:hypothetical protein
MGCPKNPSMWKNPGSPPPLAPLTYKGRGDKGGKGNTSKLLGQSHYIFLETFPMIEVG